MAKRNISEEFKSVTFPDKKEYERFEELILSGTVLSEGKAYKMLKIKTEAKKRRKDQIQRCKPQEV